MPQGSNASSGKSGSLKLICPCGFSKEIPSKFDGKKIVCPKCRKVLSVTKVKRAKLLIQCPYCQKAQRFDITVDACRSCQKSFKPPRQIEELLGQSASGQSASEVTEASLLGAESSNSGSVLDVGAGEQPRIAAVPARAKRKKRSVFWNVLIATFYIGGSAIVAWIVAGDKLGLPSFGDVTGLGVGVPEASTPAENEQNLNAVETGRGTSEQATNEGAEQKLDVPSSVSP